MSTIILSDMALLGSNVEDLYDGVKRLKELESKGVRIILLSNRPEYCMRMIGANVGDDNLVRYKYLWPVEERGKGINIIVLRQAKKESPINLKLDYMIYGNGICTLDREEELIRQDEFMKRTTIAKMIDIFESNGYSSMEKLEQDKFGDRCFNNSEDAYKFFNPENGVAKPNNRVYGMQCSGRGSEQDDVIMREIESAVPEMKAYRLNGKPCFYQRDVNKLVALNKLLDHEDINVDDCYMILSELTDDVLLREYPKQSTVVRGEMCPASTKTLAKVLKELS